MASRLARKIEAELDSVLKCNVRHAATEATLRATYHHSKIRMGKRQLNRSPLEEMMNEKSEKMSYAAMPVSV